MSSALPYFIPLALLAVVVILALGLWTMLKAGSPNRSQNLMRWRVALQFAAVILVMTAVYFIRG